MSTFYGYFKENMDGLGMAAPESLFGNLTTATATASQIVGLITKMGTKVTVRELAGAGTGLEVLMVIGACSAAGYAGAVIGSIAVATGRTLSGGTSLADVIFCANHYKLNPPWLIYYLQTYSGIYSQQGLRPNIRHQLVLA